MGLGVGTGRQTRCRTKVCAPLPVNGEKRKEKKSVCVVPNVRNCRFRVIGRNAADFAELATICLKKKRKEKLTEERESVS